MAATMARNVLCQGKSHLNGHTATAALTGEGGIRGLTPCFCDNDGASGPGAAANGAEKR